LSLYKARGDVFGVGITRDSVAGNSDALAGAVASLGITRRTVNLDELGEVDVAAKCVFDGIQIGPVTIGGKLYAMTQACC